MSRKHELVPIRIELKIDKTRIEQDIQRSITGGIETATRRIDDWLREEVSRTIEIQMKNALRKHIKTQIAKHL